MAFSLYPLWRELCAISGHSAHWLFRGVPGNGGASLAKLFCPVKTAVVAASIKVTGPSDQVESLSSLRGAP
jgi:hypothetical protein